MTHTTIARQRISEAINQVLSDSGRKVRVFQDSDRLSQDINLDSLDFATVIVRLEQSLGVDPFREGAMSVRTYGELVEVYESCL